MRFFLNYSPEIKNLYYYLSDFKIQHSINNTYNDVHKNKIFMVESKVVFRCVSISRHGPIIQSLSLSNYMVSLRSKISLTRISGPYGPLEILAPAESLLASLARMFATLTSSSSSPSTSLSPPSSPTENVCPPHCVKMFVLSPLCEKCLSPPLV